MYIVVLLQHIHLWMHACFSGLFTLMIMYINYGITKEKSVSVHYQNILDKYPFLGLLFACLPSYNFARFLL